MSSGLASLQRAGIAVLLIAKDDADALREAERSTGAVATIDRLQVWRGDQYAPARD